MNTVSASSKQASHAAAPAATARVDVSVVLYHSEPHLPGMLAALRAQRGVAVDGLTVLAHDNAPGDGSMRALRDALDPGGPGPRLVESAAGGGNLGFGAGHNRAIAAGTAPYVLLLNPDTELHPDCLATLLAAADEDGEAVAWEARQLPYEHPKHYDPASGETAWVSGACVLLRRAAFAAVGGFDEAIFLYGEDVDLSWRLRDAGGVLRYVPRALVRHHCYRQPGEVKPAQLAGGVRANLYLRLRFGGWGDVARGLCMQLAVLASPRGRPAGFRRAVLGGLGQCLLALSRLRAYPRRRRHAFAGWDYATMRAGAFHDASPGAMAAPGPLVSVLVRSTGREPLLDQALACIAGQTYPGIEAVVVLDGERVLDEQRLRARHPGLRLRYEALGEQRERCETGNRALALARGEYLCFLDEDDLLYADHVEQLLQALRADPGRLAAYGYTFELPSRVDPRSSTVTAEGALWARHAEAFSLLKLLRRNFMPINSVLFHRSLYEDCGGFDPTLERFEDWNLWLRFVSHAGPFVCVPKTTAIYRVPMDHDAGRERSAVMQPYHALAEARQGGLPLATTVADLLRESELYVRERVGLTDTLCRYFPRLAPLLRAADGMLVRLRGRRR